MKDYLLYSDNTVKINYDNIAKNIALIKKFNNKKMIAVIKNDAYNLGIEEVVKVCLKSEVNAFAVANLEEALRVRTISNSAMVLILNPIEKNFFEIAYNNNFDLVLSTFEQLEIFENFLNDIDKKNFSNHSGSLKFHIKFNCGMNRYGLNFDEIGKFIDIINNYPNVKKSIQGLMTHFPQADEVDLTKHNEQVDTFAKVYQEAVGIFNFQYVHGENSEAFLHKDIRLNFCNYSRIGILLYGYVPIKSDIILKPTMFLYNKIINIRKLNKGDYLGYGEQRVLEDCVVGICPLGYGDGIIGERKNYPVYINGKKYPILGTISMSHMYIAIDDTIKIGDKVEVFGEHIRFDNMEGVTISRLMCPLKR